MKKKVSKMFSVLLSLCMIFTLFTGTAFAASSVVTTDEELSEFLSTADKGDTATYGEATYAILKVKTCTAIGVYSVSVADEEGNVTTSYFSYGSADGHTWDDGVVTTEANCATGEDGVKTYTCTVCGETKTETIVAAHDYVGVVTTEANCATGEDGEMTYTCSACGDTYTEVIEAAHTWVEVTYNEATCGEDGSGYFMCSVCYTIGDIYTIEATGEHDYVEDTVIAATCTEPSKVGSVCSVCGAEDPEDPLTEVGEALGHTWDDGQYEAATCTEADHVLYTCIVCGETYTEETGLEDALGHTPDEAVKENEVAVTCQADGSYDSVVYCSTCGEELSRETVTVASDGTQHDYVETVLSEASCTTNGVGKYVCSICGSYKYAVIEADHTWNDGEVTTAATCTEAGVMTYTCTACGATKTEEIEATGHTWLEVTDNEATCGEDGSGHYWCSVCDEMERPIQSRRPANILMLKIPL